MLVNVFFSLFKFLFFLIYYFFSKEDNKITLTEENNLKLDKIIKDKNKIYLKSDENISNINNKTLIEIF